MYVPFNTQSKPSVLTDQAPFQWVLSNKVQISVPLDPVEQQGGGTDSRQIGTQKHFL